ncbi:hypothetical protein ALC57_15429, partial [Trachymyrmex cornetzi]
PYLLQGNELQDVLRELRNVANNASNSRYDNENNFTDEEFYSLSPITKEQFRDLFSYCDPVVQQNGLLYVSKKHLLTFLCKMRQGLSDDFLTFMFGYNSRQRTSVVIETVRKMKLALIVAPDGYILDVQGPYFSDNRNNDAAMLTNELQVAREFREWFQNGDIFILDRGYRDSGPILQQLGISVKMPAFLQRNERQLPTKEANSSRLVTKSRWIVEMRNEHLKSIFKFFAGTISVVHAVHLKDFLNIACAIINKYKTMIHMEGADVNLANELLQRATTVNIMQARVEAEDLTARGARWIKLNHNHFLGFPRLTSDYLRDLTVGVYQVRLAPAYIQDKMLRDNTQELQFDERINEPGLLRARVHSRFSGATNHQIFIAYVDHIADVHNNDENVTVQHGPILSYYCTCKAGARTLGSCAHVASILLYLGYARHQNDVTYPSTEFLENIQDTAHRN